MVYHGSGEIMSVCLFKNDCKKSKYQHIIDTYTGECSSCTWNHRNRNVIESQPFILEHLDFAASSFASFHLHSAHYRLAVARLARAASPKWRKCCGYGLFPTQARRILIRECWAHARSAHEFFFSPRPSSEWFLLLAVCVDVSRILSLRMMLHHRSYRRYGISVIKFDHVRLSVWCWSGSWARSIESTGSRL